MTKLESLHTRFLQQALRERAEMLRRLAGELDKLAREVSGADSYAAVAARAIHAVAWGVANLSMERLATEAASADVARSLGGDEPDR